MRQFTFNSESNELVLTAVLKPHARAVISIAFSPCGRFFVTSSEDNTLFFFAFDSRQFTPIGFVETSARPNSLTWKPVVESKTLLVCCEDGSVFEVVAPEVC